MKRGLLAGAMVLLALSVTGCGGSGASVRTTTATASLVRTLTRPHSKRTIRFRTLVSVSWTASSLNLTAEHSRRQHDRVVVERVVWRGAPTAALGSARAGATSKAHLGRFGPSVSQMIDGARWLVLVATTKDSKGAMVTLRVLSRFNGTKPWRLIQVITARKAMTYKVLESTNTQTSA